MPHRPLRETDGALRALVRLFGTAPAPGLPEGLHYPSQLRELGEEAGLQLGASFSLDTYVAELRAGAGTAAAMKKAEQTPTMARQLCPAPIDADVRPVRRLRDQLWGALVAPTESETAAALSSLSAQSGLYPGLDERSRPVMMVNGEDFSSYLGAALVHAALRLVSSGQRERLRACGAPDCGLPFLDRSSDGRGLFCSRRCAARTGARKRRDRGPHDQYDQNADARDSRP